MQAAMKREIRKPHSNSEREFNLMTAADDLFAFRSVSLPVTLDCGHVALRSPFRKSFLTFWMTSGSSGSQQFTCHFYPLFQLTLEVHTSLYTDCASHQQFRNLP